MPAGAYPVRAVGTLWEVAAPPSGDPLARVIGPGRAALLHLLDTAVTTTDLARLTGMSAGDVSQHLGALHAAGLVSRSRQGRHVLYRNTDAARGLLGPAGAGDRSRVIRQSSRSATGRRRRRPISRARRSGGRGGRVPEPAHGGDHQWTDGAGQVELGREAGLVEAGELAHVQAERGGLQRQVGDRLTEVVRGPLGVAAGVCADHQGGRVSVTRSLPGRLIRMRFQVSSSRWPTANRQGCRFSAEGAQRAASSSEAASSGVSSALGSKAQGLQR